MEDDVLEAELRRQFADAGMDEDSIDEMINAIEETPWTT